MSAPSGNKVPRTVAITSGKGGVGKSNLSVNIALYLGRLGYRTCLFDADLGLANVNVLLDIQPSYTLEDVLFNQIPLDDIIVKNHRGIEIIPGSSGLEQMANLEGEQLDRLIDTLSGLNDYDYIIFDTSSGINRQVVTFCLCVSELLLVITPEPTSMIDAFALLKVLSLNGLQGTVGIIINQCSSKDLATKTYNRFKEVVGRHLSVKISPLGLMLHDPKIEEAVRKQQPVLLHSPRSMASKCIRLMSKRLADKKSTRGESEDIVTFWIRYFDLLHNPLSLVGIEENKDAKNVPSDRDTTVTGRSRDSSDKQPDVINLLLPSPPQILLPLVEAVSDSQTPSVDLADLIKMDPSITFAVLAFTCSPTFGPPSAFTSLERSIELLGTDTIKGVVETAALQSALDPIPPDMSPSVMQFALHSLSCATLAAYIADRAGIPREEAYLAGLLHDIGRPAIWAALAGRDVNPNGPPPGGENSQDREAEVMDGDHCEIGARLINHWRLPSFFADAALYHHETPDRIRDAFPLVKIVYLANMLCLEEISGKTKTLITPDDMLGFSRSTLIKLKSVADRDLKQRIRRLGIKIDRPGDNRILRAATRQLGKKVRPIALIGGATQRLLGSQDRETAFRLWRVGLSIVLGLDALSCLVFEKERNHLRGRYAFGTAHSELVEQMVIPLKIKNSILVQAFDQGQIVHSATIDDRHRLPLVDEQIRRALAQEVIYCVPVIRQKQCFGVLALGVDRSSAARLNEEDKTILLLAAQAALSFEARPTFSDRSLSSGEEASEARRMSRRAVRLLTVLGTQLGELQANPSEKDRFDQEIKTIRATMAQLKKTFKGFLKTTRDAPKKWRKSADEP